MLFSKILVPVDGSKDSLLAKHKAVELASVMGAKIFLLHAVGAVPELIGGISREQLISGLTHEARKLLAPYRDTLDDKGVEYSEIIEAADPADAVLNVARREQCDLIVIGSRGRSDLSSLVLGSVTHRVLHLSPVPVLMVR